MAQDQNSQASLWFDLAENKRLGNRIEWQRVLLYTPHWLTPASSLADQQDFFLDADGKHDPNKELHATIKSFFTPWTGDPDRHPICRYPRRLKFIEQALSVTLPEALHPPCTRYHAWREEHPVDGMSLVFAANYLNNPASLYGHTFIRLHRRRDDGTGSSALLDYAVNFAANPTTSNPLLYPLLGMSGRFFGTFSLMPYYVKVQEYNNAESRDLYEYPLNFSADEIDNFMAALWEAGPYGIRYWYMDDNCSYILLAMIESAKPSIAVTETFMGVVSPKDTLLALKPHGLLGSPVRRPSTLTRIKVRRRLLSSYESTILLEQLNHETLTSELMALPPSEKSRVLDTLLEWIAWKEKLAGSKVAEAKSALWKSSLEQRAKLGTTSPALDLSLAPASPPHEGHKSHRTYLAYRFVERSNPEILFGLRLTLHDFLSPPAGYSPEQETTMGDAQGIVHRNASGQLIAEWERFTWIRILSVPGYDAILPSPSWTLTAQTQRMWGFDKTPWLTHKLEAGVGMALAEESFRAWLIPVFVVGHLLPVDRHGIHGGIGLRAGLAADAFNNVRVVVGSDIDHWLAVGANLKLYDTHANVAWMPTQDHELRLGLRQRRKNLGDWNQSAEILWMRYF